MGVLFPSVLVADNVTEVGAKAGVCTFWSIVITEGSQCNSYKYAFEPLVPVLLTL